MRRAVVIVTLLLGALAPAAAAEQPPTSVLVPPPLQTQLKLKVERVGGARATALVGAPIRVGGTTQAYVAGQSITVRFYVAGRKRDAKRVTLRPLADGTGGFMLSYKPRRPGALVIRAAHEATPQLAALAARGTTVDVIPRSVAPRSGKVSIRALQRRLSRLGYVTGAPGVYDERTSRAVLAFRKVTGMDRTTNASLPVMRALARGAGRYKIKFPEHGRHIEADLSLQVIALIEGGRVQRIYPVSSGKPSTPTVQGSFRVYSKTPGTNAKGMVDSAYFIRGYATHGYASVPVYPASHGCLRVPVPDARSLFDWIVVGTPVDVYP